MTQRSFDNTNTWIFDLDNTLYPAECNLFAQVDLRMATFISEFLSVPMAEAQHLRKSYYRQFGTTLAGLTKLHNMQPSKFLDYVHDIDLSVVKEEPDLHKAIDALPGRILIYTNGSQKHGARVAEKLGVLSLFEDICSIESCQYIPKPKRAAFEKMISAHNVIPKNAAMFEDIPHNLQVPHEMGMTTVLVAGSDIHNSAQPSAKNWTQLPEHVHYEAQDLCTFLKDQLKLATLS